MKRGYFGWIEQPRRRFPRREIAQPTTDGIVRQGNTVAPVGQVMSDYSVNGSVGVDAVKRILKIEDETAARAAKE